MTIIRRGSIFLILLVTFLGIISRISEALQCNSCNGVDNLAECQREETCDYFPNDPLSTQICQNDYRIINNKVTMRKKCKARQACLTEEKMPDNKCDIHSGKDTVCRCCCDTDNCNSKKIGCIAASDCKKPVRPKNGYVKCRPPIKLGDKCSYRCKAGYKLSGSQFTKCSKDFETGTLTWKPSTIPSCVERIIRCNPVHTDPKNGRVICRNSVEYEDKPAFNYEGSVCNFECNEFFQLMGKKKSTCLPNSQWSNKAPTCRRGKCIGLLPDINRVEECTEGYFVGSECQFKCKKGYKLTGTTKTVCNEVSGKLSGKWSEDPPRCKKIMCRPIQTNPLNGKVKCSNKNFENSVCTFTCNKGYDVDGTIKGLKRITCEHADEKSAFGEWSGPPATCSKIVCNPPSTAPKHGRVSCTNGNDLGSACVYNCKIGYDLDESKLSEKKVVCEDDGDGDDQGKWSKPPATCSPIRCEPPHKHPQDGNVICTNRNFEASVCSFRCDEFYDLDNTIKTVWESTCIDDHDGDALGKWNRPAATCTLVQCNPKHSNPKNGFVFCSAENLLGSVCHFKCLEGYKLIGEASTSCVDQEEDGDAFAEWTFKAPKCVRGRCKEPIYDKSKINMDCGDGEGVKENLVGTVCTYTCRNEGHFLTPDNDQKKVIKEGKMDVKCNVNETWSFNPPLCLLVKCLPVLTAPKFGYPPRCSNSNFYDSQCIFRCKDTYGLTHSRPLTCESDDDKDEYGKWSEDAPTCQRITCDDFGQIKHGALQCSDGHNIDSDCKLTCNKRYIAKKYESTTCLANQKQGKPDWSRRKYVCCVPCRFNPELMLVMVVDKTATQTLEDWYLIVDFTQITLFDLKSNGFKVNFGLVLYDTEVDKENILPLKVIKRWEDIDQLVVDMELMPFGGKVSNSGKAMSYANEVMFSSPTDEEPYLVLVIGGKSNDDVKTIAKTIREREISILSVGLNIDKTRSPVDQKDLLEITGVEENQFTAESLSQLRKTRERITEISIQQGCSKSSKSQPCPK